MLPRAPSRARPNNNDNIIAIGIGAAIFGMFALELLRGFTIAKLSVPFILAAYVPLLVIHEAGHAIAAWLVGSRVCKIVVGMGKPIWQFRVGSVPVTLRLVPASGYVVAAPQSLEGARWRSAVVYLGGPGIELLLLVALALSLGPNELLTPSDDIWMIALQSLAVALALDVVFNLAPVPTADGALRDGLGIIVSPFLTDSRIETWIASGYGAEIEPWLQRGRVEEAVAIVQAAVERHPNNVNLSFLLAEVLCEAGRPREAGQHLEPLLERSLPSVHRAWLHAHIAAAARDLEDPELYDIAWEHIRKALEFAPNELQFHVTRATILLERGQAKTAADALHEALDGFRALPPEVGEEDHRPRDECEAWLALARFHQGRVDEAHEHLRSLIDRGAQGRLLDRVRREVGSLADAEEGERARG